MRMLFRSMPFLWIFLEESCAAMLSPKELSRLLRNLISRFQLLFAFRVCFFWSFSFENVSVLVLMVTFSGTKVEDAKALIATSQLRILPCDNLDEVRAFLGIYRVFERNEYVLGMWISFRCVILWMIWLLVSIFNQVIVCPLEEVWKWRSSVPWLWLSVDSPLNGDLSYSLNLAMFFVRLYFWQFYRFRNLHKATEVIEFMRAQNFISTKPLMLRFHDFSYPC